MLIDIFNTQMPDQLILSIFIDTKGLTLLLASWLSRQDPTKFVLHRGDHGTHGKIRIKILLR